MKNKFLITILFFGIIKINSQNLMPGFGSQRAGTSVFTFLQIGVSPRGIAMSDAVNSFCEDPSSLYYNPARAVMYHRNQTMVSHGFWFAGTQHNFTGIIYKLTENDAVGISINSFFSDKMEKRTEFLPEGTGEYFSFNDFSIAGTFSKRLTEQFSFGATARYISENLAQYKMQNILFDLGISYDLGNEKSQFAITYTNFGNSSKPVGSKENGDEFEEYLPPTLFAISLASEIYKDEEYKITGVAQLSHPNDNSEYLAFGMEVDWRKIFFIRTGIRANYQEQNYPSFGVGFVLPYDNYIGKIDYGFSSLKNLGFTHRVSLNFIL